MKKALVFLGLKVAEISVIFFVPYGFGYFLIKYIGVDSFGNSFWATGAFYSLSLFAIVLILVGIILANIELTKLVIKKWRGS